MIYAIAIRKIALKELALLPFKIQANISLAIDNLAENPQPTGCKKIKGQKEYLWRIRVGDYRVIYAIENEIRIIEVRKIGHRKNVYQ